MTLLAKSADESGNCETLLDHTRSILNTATALLNRLAVTDQELEEIRKELAVAAALHDMGKAAAGFQQMLTGEAQNWHGWRHEILSASLASSLDVPQTVVFAILTHHKQIPGENAGTLVDAQLEPPIPDKFLAELTPNADQINQLWSEIITLIGRPDLARDLMPTATLKLAPKWLDESRTNGQTKHISFKQRHRASLLRGLLISADHLASGHVLPPPTLHPREFKPKLGIKLRRFQESCADATGHLILRAPTGSGKTEAALLWAGHNQHERGKLFYVLPNQASINAMYARLRREFPAKTDSVGLLHSRAAHHLLARISTDYDADPHRAQAESIARARLAKEMYYPVRVCTPHQLLRLALHGRGWEQMLTEVPGACVIFDEIHSYDAKLAGLTIGAARLFAQLGARVMFISATLPAFQETELRNAIPGIACITPDPAFESDREILGRLRHDVRLVDGTLIACLPDIIARADAGEHVLVVCNHVRSAQGVVTEIRKNYPHHAPELLHGRFHSQDRQYKESKLALADLPSILVATQVVEVSLDVSFTVGFFEPAEIDALAQRMGRVNRQGTAPRPIFICRQQMNNHRLYDPGRTRDSLDRLNSRTMPITEQDLVDIANHVYQSGYSDEDLQAYNERLNHPFFVEFEDRLLAGRHEDWVEQVVDRTDGQVEVLPRSLREKHKDYIKDRLWLKADGLLVQVYATNKWDRINMEQDPWVINAPYTDLGLEA